MVGATISLGLKAGDLLGVGLELGWMGEGVGDLLGVDDIDLPGPAMSSGVEEGELDMLRDIEGVNEIDLLMETLGDWVEVGDRVVVWDKLGV